MKRISLLDTDFISKAHSIRTDNNNHLIDRVLELPSYSFCSHSQIVTELARHNSEAPAWLEEHIKSGVIEEYSDERIIHEMKELYYNAGCSVYTAFLKNACNVFEKNYFQDHFGQLERLDHFKLTEQEYLRILNEMDSQIGAGNNLGEIKSYVTLQWINTLTDTSVLYFCSDDRGARNGIFAVKDLSVRCISIPSVFQRLLKEGVFTVPRCSRSSKGVNQGSM